MARWFYSIIWYLAVPGLILHLLWKSRRLPAYRRHLGERLGRHPVRTGTRPLIWVHAVSVGETRAAQPLIEALLARRPDADVLITHGTPTGRDTSAALFANARVRRAYLPWDCPGAIRRFLRAWRPSVGLLVETELWPNLVAQCRRRGVPLALVNARLSERSCRKGERWARLIVPALAGLDLVLAQSEDDAARLARLGRSGVPVLGNLKFDVAPAPAQEALGHQWRLDWLACRRDRGQARACVLAASTREGEEDSILDAWHEALRVRGWLSATAVSPLLVVVPRHPQRFDAVAAAIAARGWRSMRRSRIAAGRICDAQVILGDSMGEMAAWYALADVAIIGGSLLPHGGQNLIEACAAGVPVIVGPHTFNFADATALAIEADAAVRVADAAAAIDAALSIVTDAHRLQTMSDCALAFTARHRGATDRTLAAIEPLLPPTV